MLVFDGVVIWRQNTDDIMVHAVIRIGWLKEASAVQCRQQRPTNCAAAAAALKMIRYPIQPPSSLSSFLPPSEIGFSYLRSLSLSWRKERGGRGDLLSRKQSEIKTADKSDVVVVEVEIARAGA